MLAGYTVAVNIHSLAAKHLALHISLLFWGKLGTKNMATWPPDPPDTHAVLYTSGGKNKGKSA